MSGVPSAFILVLVEVEEVDFVVPAGVAVVLDLLMVAELLVIVLDLVLAAGAAIVPDLAVLAGLAIGLGLAAAGLAGAPALVVAFAAGVCTAVVVIFDDLVLFVVVPAGAAGAAVWARAAEPPKRLNETRKLRMRFIKSGFKGEYGHTTPPEATH